MIIDSLIWSHLQQTLRVNQTCYWYCRLWCRLLSTIASCFSRLLQVNWISSAKILSFRPRHSVDCNSCSATIFKLFCSKKFKWWRVLMNSDSRWLSESWDFVHWSSNSQCVSHSAALCRNLSCQDTDVFSTTCWGQKGIWQTQLGTNSDLGLSLDTETCIVHKQTNKDCASRATINSDRSATSSVWHKQGEKQPRRRDVSNLSMSATNLSPFQIPPRTMRVRGTIQVRLSFLIDGFLTAPSQL